MTEPAAEAPAGAYAYVPPTASVPPETPPAPTSRPELLVGAAFAGGVLLAVLLKRAGRVD